MCNLEKAIAIAIDAHSGQVDKASQPYILHPLRLMFKFQVEVEMIVAVLHDVIEDSNISLDDLKVDGFSTQVIDAIDCLSKRDGECYEDFILRLSINDLARKVKIEDVKDNLDLTRLEHVRNKDLVRIDKYHRSLMLLISKDANRQL